MRKDTHEDFLHKLKNKHGYEYLDTFEFISKYESYSKNILIKTEFGVHSVPPNSLNKGYLPTIQSATDKNCYFYNMVSALVPEFLECAKITGDYTSANEKIKIRDRYGYCEISPANILGGSLPCIKSAINKHEYYMEMLKEKNITAYNTLEFIEKVEKTNSIVLVKDKYGELKVSPNRLLQGKIPIIESAIDKTKYFKNKLKDSQPELYCNIEILGDYISTKTKILIRNKYGLCESTPSELLNGTNPTIRSAVNKTEYAICMSKDIHGERYSYDKFTYTKHKDDVVLYCNNHKEYFSVRFGHHIHDSVGCPKCNMSKGELAIEKYLLSLKIRFEKQKTFYNCIYKQKLQFDFHLPDYGMCIEYDGEQHFKPLTFFGGEAAFKDLKIKDNIKTQYCKENEIKLIRISYWDFENIENILIKELKI